MEKLGMISVQFSRQTLVLSDFLLFVMNLEDKIIILGSNNELESSEEAVSVVTQMRSCTESCL